MVHEPELVNKGIVKDTFNYLIIILFATFFIPIDISTKYIGITPQITSILARKCKIFIEKM